MRVSATSTIESYPSKSELGCLSSKVLFLNVMCLVSTAVDMDIRNDLVGTVESETVWIKPLVAP